MIHVADCTGYSVEGREIFKGALLTRARADPFSRTRETASRGPRRSSFGSFPVRRRAEASQPKVRRPKRKKSSAKAKPAA
jgi:hypothetical protein